MTFSVLTYGAPQDWQTGVMYPPGVAVVFGGTLWRCLRAHESVSPVEGAFWTAVLSGGGGLPTGLTYASPCLEVGTDVANQAVICGASSSNAVSLSTAGSDAAVNLSVVTKGTGFTELLSAFLQIHPDNTTSSSLILAGATGSNPVSISAAGVATDIGINLVPKGSGLFTVNSLPVGSPGGSANSFQYNDGAGAFAGSLMQQLEPQTIGFSDPLNLSGVGALFNLGLLPAAVLGSNGFSSLYIGPDTETNQGAQVNLYGTVSSNPPVIATVFGRGTIASGASVQTGDKLFSVVTNGLVDTDWTTKARPASSIFVLAENTPSPGDISVAGSINFWTGGGGATALTERMQISSTGLTTITGSCNVTAAYQANGTPGVGSGSFTTNDGKTVTVKFGLITAITP